MKQKAYIIILCVLWLNISICNAQQSARSSITNNQQHNYSDNSFNIVSSYNIGGNIVVLEKKIDTNYYRTNGDKIRFYKTTFAIGIKSGNKAERTIIETDAYIASTTSYEKMSQPCMLIDPKKQVIYIFSNSKSTDPYYGMDGYVYRVDLEKKRWTREVVFEKANFGWFSFFGGSNNGNPELWHFSYAGYYIIKSSRNSSGSWNNYNMGSIRPEQAEAQYPYHKNILVTSTSNVDRMSTNYVKNNQASPSNSIAQGISNKTLMTGAAFVTVGAMVYGLFKLLGSVGTSSNGGSSYSSFSNNSSSSNVSSNEKKEIKIDVENINMPNYEWTTDWGVEGVLSPIDSHNNKNNAGENQARKIKFPGVGTGKITRVIGEEGYWTSREKRYKTLEDAIIAEYVNLKYGKVREKGRMVGIFY